MRVDIRRTFNLSEEQAREAAFRAAGNAVGVLRKQRSIIKRVSIEPHEPAVTFEGLGGRQQYSLVLGDLSAAVASGQWARLIEIREIAKTSLDGCEAMGDVAVLWPHIKRVAAALLAYGELSLERLLDLVPGEVLSTVTISPPSKMPEQSANNGYRLPR
jgi:hypothetical protein